VESRTERQKPEYKLKGPVRTTATSNHFFGNAGTDLCDIIGSRATTQTIRSLSLVSKGAKYCFEKSLNLHHDAHVILQAIMNHPEEIPNVLRQAETLWGKENVWKLLLMPIPATEEHCKRHWPDKEANLPYMTAIKFAAWSGDLYQYLYELTPMPQDANAELEQGKLYVAIDTLGISNENCLTYLVINPEGELVKNAIYQEQLGCTLSDPLNLDELSHHLPAIMAIIYERGEMNDVNPRQTEIADTYLLNLLYKYIPQEYRHIANEQLWDLQVSGSAMSPYVELVDEYDDYVNEFDKRKWGERGVAWQKGCGVKQQLLPWFGLRVMCDEIVWNPMPDFNQLRAPVGEPMIDVEGSKRYLKSCMSGLGSSWAIYHFAMAGGASGLDRPGPCVDLSREVIIRFVEVKNMQLGAFIAWQKLLEEKYRDEQKNSVKLVCR
jgi:hypothetical protein